MEKVPKEMHKVLKHFHQFFQQWEMTVLDVLQWDLSAVTPYSIMDHILRTVPFGSKVDPEVVRKHAETFVALAATEHLFSLKSPATVAISCLGAALRGLNPQGLEVMLAAIFLNCSAVDMVSSKIPLYSFNYTEKNWRERVVYHSLAISCCYLFTALNQSSGKHRLNEIVCSYGA